MNSIPILFWLNDECVLTLDRCAIHPAKGDTVYMEAPTASGFFKVDKLVWSFRYVKSFDGSRSLDDNRLEVHLTPK